MQPFQMAGSLDIYPASTCARVVASGGCGAPMPTSEGVASLNPEEACQQAIEAGLVVHRAHPLNCETSIPALTGGVVMPSAHFYVRNHFQIPTLDPATFRLQVGGVVDRPLSLIAARPPQPAVADAGRHAGVRGQRPHAVRAGHRRREVESGCRQHRGVDRRAAGRSAGSRGRADRAREKSCSRAPTAARSTDTPDPIRFERSLSLDDARDDDVLLAYAMNGEPLPFQHGYPLRLIVPGWYAVASVKWLTEIELLDHAVRRATTRRTSTGMSGQRDGKVVREPVAVQRVRALIAEPAPNADVPSGDTVIRGVAWSGAAPIARVEVSVGDGDWREARLVGERRRHGWQWWELVAAPRDEPGATTLRARATDLAGRTQPEHAEWNRLGYGNNSIQQRGDSGRLARGVRGSRPAVSPSRTGRHAGHSRLRRSVGYKCGLGWFASRVAPIPNPTSPACAREWTV